MSRLRFRISMSLDGYVAGPEQSVENPLGGGERLFENVGTALHGMTLVRTIAAPGVTHLELARS